MTSFARNASLAFLVSTSGLATAASATIWHIEADGSGDFPTIQAGVDAAAVGDTVLVGPGIYSDTHAVGTRAVNILVTKDIVLMSLNGALNTKLVGTDIVIWCQGLGTSALVQGFDIALPELGGWGCVGPIAAGRDVNRSAPPLLTTGLYLQESAVTIADNVLRGGFQAIRLEGSDATVIRNNVANCSYGIDVQGGDASIIENTVLDCGSCISSYEASTLIRDNVAGGQFKSPCVGISVVIGSPHVVGNRIQNCDLDAVFCASSATIENNIIRGGYRFYTYYAHDCVIRGNVLIDTVMDVQYATGIVEQNTIIGGLVLSGVVTFTRNLVVRAGIHCYDPATVTCNNSWGATENYMGGCAAGQNGNISVEPQFCGIEGSGNYYLQQDSPCAPGNHPHGMDCGVIGAFGVACGPVKAQSASLGGIKALYRK
jgi:hypothetical protein